MVPIGRRQAELIWVVLREIVCGVFCTKGDKFGLKDAD